MVIKRGDWVTAKSCPTLNGNQLLVVGTVRRVARDGSWCDVRWRSGGVEWSKRMPADSLVIRHTIPFLGGTVTDMTRQKELDG